LRPNFPNTSVTAGTRSSACVTAGTRLAAAIAAEKLDEFGNVVQPYRRRPVQPRNSNAVAKRKRAPKDDLDEVGTDADDDSFSDSESQATSSDGLGSDDDTNVVEISNEEVWKLSNLSLLIDMTDTL
jgi:hypothetical protein